MEPTLTRVAPFARIKAARTVGGAVIVRHTTQSVSVGFKLALVQVFMPLESQGNGALFVVVAGASDGMRTSIILRRGKTLRSLAGTQIGFRCSQIWLRQLR